MNEFYAFASDNLHVLWVTVPTSKDPFESPIVGIVAGLVVVILGIVALRFAPSISRFMTSMNAQTFGEKWVDALAKTQVLRLRAMGVLMLLLGAAIFTIGAVSASRGL